MTISIPYEIRVANTFYKRFKGLMFRKEPINDEGLWIIPCNAVHMFFMKFPIDVVLINEQHEVVGVHKSLKPWRMTRPIEEAYSTLELPVGSVDKFEISIGCKIECSVIK